jgi:hypothetical protein
MSLISTTIPSLINGMSQQPAALRLSSQADDAKNCSLSPVEGLARRSSSNHLAVLYNGSGLAGTNKPFFRVINQDSSNQYFVVLENGTLRVFDLNGSAKTIVAPYGYAYLNLASQSPTSAFRIVSIADTTFILNREKTAAMAATLSPFWGYESMVFVRTADYSTTYWLTVNGVMVTSTTAAVGGTPPDTLFTAFDLAGKMAWAINPLATTRTASGGTTNTITFATTTGIVVGQYLKDATGHMLNGAYVTAVTATQVTFTPPATQAIQNGTLITFKGQTFYCYASYYDIIVGRTDGSNFSIDAGDNRTGNAMSVIKGAGVVDSLSDLPTSANHGFTVKVQGDSASATDDFWVRFVTDAGSGWGNGVWRETVAPSIPYLLDGATMPHVLTRNSNGTFTFSQFNWSGRVAGDATTAPNPSFVGKKIQALDVYQGRLVLLADENAILSATDDYSRFYPETVQTVVDSDPIDITAGGQSVNILVASAAVNDTLLLMSRNAQFKLDTGGANASLTPRTATITRVTAFETLPDVEPVVTGRLVYLPTPRGGDRAGVRELLLTDSSGPAPASEDITAAVPTLLGSNLFMLAACAEENTLVALTREYGHRIFVYKYLYEQDKKLQSAWSYWDLGDGYDDELVLGAQTVGSDLYIMVERRSDTAFADQVSLERISLRPVTTDPGAQYEIHIDRRVTEAQCLGTQLVVANPPVTRISLPYRLRNEFGNVISPMAVVGRYDTTAPGPTPGAGAPGKLYTQRAINGGTAPNSNAWIEVEGNLVGAKFYVGEPYQMEYKFSTQYIKESPAGGGVAVAAGVYLQLRTWSMVFDKTGAFEVVVDATGRDQRRFRYTPYTAGGQGSDLGAAFTPAGNLQTGSMRVPVMARNTDASVSLFSLGFFPCRFQSAEWEAWYHARGRRM